MTLPSLCIDDFNTPTPYLPANCPEGPVLFHADIFRAMRFGPRNGDRHQLLNCHLSNLQSIAPERSLWMPAFNYDFLDSGRFNPDLDSSQVGPLSEAFRQQASFRSWTPVFGISSTSCMDQPQRIKEIDPFDYCSDLGRLVQQQGVVVLYGTPISSLTLIHVAERLAGGPLYRYDKIFNGVVGADSTDQWHVALRYHVRPLGVHFQYDWPRLCSELTRENLLISLDDYGIVYWAPAYDLMMFWIEQLRIDPLHFLDEKSRTWIEPELDRLGRRFEKGDFE